MVRALLAVVSALALAACASFQPEPADWQRLGFRTPDQALHTFRVAFATEQLDLEYRCLSASLKRERGLNQTAYRSFRAQLEREVPFLGAIATAEVIGSRPLGPGRHWMELEVRVWPSVHRLGVEFEREDYYELWRGEERIDDDFVDFERAAWVEGDAAAPTAVGAAVAPRPDLDLSGAEPPGFDELRVGREWKIAGFRSLEETAASDPDPEPSPPAP